MGPQSFAEFGARLREAQEQGDAGVVQLVHSVVAEALRRDASDIHLEPSDDRTTLRFRLDGVLHDVAVIERKLHANIISRIKVLSDLLTYRSDIPQEGRVSASKYGGGSDLRVSTFPTIHGEKAVIRIFDPSRRLFTVESLGFPEAVLGSLKELLTRPQGVLLLTGPSASGKTTTLYSCLRYILEKSNRTRNVVTVEDPVECAIPGTSQTEIHAATGLTFARVLRSLLRQDPEVMMIGEIRDPETAAIAIEAGLTGHLVLSCIHSGTACGVFSRLLDMGIEPYLITSAVSMVIAQRLVRALCDRCKAPAAQADAGSVRGSEMPAFSPRGCEACFQTGYAGRRPLVESLVVSKDIRQAILARADLAGLQEVAGKLGMATLLDHGLELVRGGVTSVQELGRVLGV